MPLLSFCIVGVALLGSCCIPVLSFLGQVELASNLTSASPSCVGVLGGSDDAVQARHHPLTLPCLHKREHRGCRRIHSRRWSPSPAYDGSSVCEESLTYHISHPARHVTGPL